MDSTQSNVNKQPLADTSDKAEQTKTKPCTQAEQFQRDLKAFHDVDFWILPSHSTLVFAEQKVFRSGSSHRLSIGSISTGKDTTLPIWAHLAKTEKGCEVEFRYDAGMHVNWGQHDQITLVKPFCDVTPEATKSKYSPLASLVVYYFIVAGLWDKFPPQNSKSNASFTALRKACKEIIARTGAENEGMDRQASTDDGKAEALTTKHVTTAEIENQLYMQLMLAQFLAQGDEKADLIEALNNAHDLVQKHQLLEAEVNAKEAQLAGKIDTLRKAFRIAQTHSTWASDLFTKKIPQNQQSAATLAFDEQKVELDAMIKEFDEQYGM